MVAPFPFHTKSPAQDQVDSETLQHEESEEETLTGVLWLGYF